MMKKLIILFLLISHCASGQSRFDEFCKKTFKYSTFYTAVTGNTSVSDVDVFSVTNGLQTSTLQTPYDYNVALGIRKIARFGYENRAQTFYDGTEKSFSDAATIGKVSGLEFLIEIDKQRQRGVDYNNKNYFLRYVANNWISKIEYLKDGFADVEYFEASQRYRYKFNRKFSVNIGAAQRIAEPYGYNPLDEWLLDNGGIHYTYLAIQEGYNIDVFNSEYTNPSGTVVATSSEVWEQVVIPVVLRDYVEAERGKIPSRLSHSLIIGYDFYHYTKNFWVHSWGNILPYHYDDGNEFNYHKYNNDEQWYDYSGGLIFGYKVNKHLGTFVEGKYNKYWNREWYDFKLGINYVIF
jgi:hypothetical protein|tara:strand:- start:1771 stop:2823 length:1053 start_codon:yes stop_codon:yes gene_type:complete